MCGILGIIGEINDTSTAPIALDILQHRGPNGRGVWHTQNVWLGHRRLSIIDIEGGYQPMIDDESGVALIFNGEIYNYIELRNELVTAGHKFRTHSDTEVLLKSYLEWGTQCVQRFNGMWAFVVWDPRINKAFFSRDRFGVKPLYYSLVRNRLSIASEPKALLALYPELRKVNEQTLYRFFVDSSLYTTEHSFYAGIYVLKSAHFGSFAPGWSEPKLTRYYDYPSEENQLEESSTLPDQFQMLFEDAVRIRLRSDVPVGITLSGGLDSTAVTHAASQHSFDRNKELIAFTSVYSHEADKNRLDELEWAKVASKACPHHVRLIEVEANIDDWLEDLYHLIYHLDGPNYSPAVFPLSKIMKTASVMGVPVLLEGQGADELLGGYTQYAALAFLKELSKNGWFLSIKNFKELVDKLKNYCSFFPPSTFLGWMLRLSFPKLITLHRQQNGILGTLNREFIQETSQKTAIVTPNPTTVEEALLTDFSQKILPGLLHYGDAISMAYAIESRQPFLDYRLVEFCMRLPSHWKVNSNGTKYILRQHLRQQGQVTIANRKDKKGYPTPIEQWFALKGRVVLNELLSDKSSLVLRGYCEPKEVQRLIRSYVRGNSLTTNHLYRLIATELWLRRCIDVS